MKTTYKECRICGKEYQSCGTHKKETELFRWQDVACCPEHGSEYFRKIIESRRKDSDSDNEQTPH